MVLIHLIPNLRFRDKKGRFVSVSIWSPRFLYIMSVDEKKVDTPSQEELQEALDLMKKAYDIMKKQALDVRKEKEVFDSVAKKLKHVHFASVLKLNVGGKEFITSLQTLTKDTGSTLHAMFSGRFETKPTEDGSYFIDREGKNFGYILNYLPTGRLILPPDAGELLREELLEEAAIRFVGSWRSSVPVQTCLLKIL